MAIRWAAFFLLFAVLAGGAVAANPTPPTAVAAMKPLDFLIGRWRGRGYIEYIPGQRHAFIESEHVSSRLGGAVLFIEGVGRSQVAPGRTAVTHQAMALVSYNAATGDFRWNAYSVAGPHLEYSATQATVTASPHGAVVRWGYTAGPVGRFRFTFHLDRQGRWSEVGEMSRDGQTWRRFFSMTLHRVR